MNETIIDFLRFLNIDFEKFNTLESRRVKSGVDVNVIIDKFALYKPQREMQRVSIADVVGYDYVCRDLDGKNIIYNLSEFFDRDGDGYHKRSVSMLEIPTENLLENLKHSFVAEPICLQEVDKGVYNISSNGLHRFHVIKMHYLNELSKINPQNKAAIAKLGEKYSFDAKISEVDFVKTYSSFLLNLVNKQLNVGNEYVNWQVTGNVCITSDLEPDQKLVLNNEQLIDFVNVQLKDFYNNAPKKEVKRVKDIIQFSYGKFESFKDYYTNSLKQEVKEEGPWTSLS